MTLSINNANDLYQGLSVDDVAATLGISRGTAFKLVKQPGFPSIRVNSKRIITPKEMLIKWLTEQAEKTLV